MVRQSHESHESHVVVVGAGIAGLAAALLLSRIVERVTVLERAAEPAEIGAALMLQPNGLAVLDGLGLADDLRARGHTLRRMEIRNAQAEIVGSANMPDFGDGLDHYVAVIRRDLHAVLLAAVRSEPRITFESGVTVTDARREGSVLTAAKVWSADLVVGADGAGSAVRRAGDFEATVSDRQTRYIRALVRGPANESFAEYWTPLGSFGAVPLGPDLTYCYAAAYRSPAAEALSAGDLTGFVRAWQAVLPTAGEILGRIEHLDALLINGVRRVRCRAWWDGRLVLIGDAAHAMAPNLGQGANSGLVDAAVLAQEISVDQPLEAALARYQARRRGPVTRIQIIAERLAGWSGLREPLSTVRDAAFRAAARLPGLMERQIRSGQQEDPATVRRWVAELGVAGSQH